MASQHQVLIDSISAAVVAALTPLIEDIKTQIGAEFVNSQVLVSSVLAKLEVTAAAEGPQKRTTRGTRATGGAAPPGGAPDDPAAKVKNAMLFTRWEWANNPDFRARHTSEAAQAEFDKDPSATKHPAESEERLKAEGGIFWRKVASEPQKKEIRDAFGAWKEERMRAVIPDPLTPDTAPVAEVATL